MSANAPWSVKGIDPKAREIAKDLARRSGMTLGEWLNQMILEGDGEEDNVTPLPRRTVNYAGFDRRGRNRRLDDAYDYAGYDEPAPLVGAGEAARVAAALDALSARIEAAERRSTLAISGVGQAVNGLLGRLEGAEATQAVHTEKLGEMLGDIRDNHDRMRRLERDAGGPRSTEALRALEGALGKIANQLYEGEARTRASLTELREDVGGMARRVTRLEADERQADTALVEGVVSKIAERLERAEAQTSGALDALQSSFADLDVRLRTAESRLDPEREARFEHGLEALAGDLSRQMAEVRGDLARRIDEAAAEGRFDKLERTVADLAAHVGAAEQRSAQAVERMGHEVLRIGQNLNRRMNEVEAGGAAVVRKAGADMARLAQAMETRLGRTEAVQGEALERLGAEIARISERFTEKLAHAERRAALASEDVGEQVARLADKVEARYERASGEIAERIRESEERTARLLEEARLKIEAQLDQQARRRRPEPEEPVWEAEPEAAFAPAAGSEVGFDPIFDAPDPGFSADTQFTTDPFAVDPFAPAEPAAPAMRSPFGDFPAADPFAAPEAPAAPVSHALDDEEAAAAARPPVSTREAIEAARAAARLGVRNGEGGPSLGLKLGVSKNRLQERLEKERRRESSTVKKALLALAVAGALPSAVVGYHLVTTEGAEEETAVASQPMLAAVALSPELAPAVAPEKPVAEDREQADALYLDAKKQLEARKPGGLAVLQRAANLGSPQAQYHMAELLEDGLGGMAKNPAESRRWLQRAAEGGLSTAMHALGEDYAEGLNGQADPETAIKWFRKAAEAGYRDSLYNLGFLFDGYAGVERDPVEAYTWYLIAARGGDDQARQRADALETELTATQRRGAQRAALAFHVKDEPLEFAAR